MLIENTLFGTVDKVQESIDLLKKYEPSDGYYVCFSGGKDSTVIYDLVKRAGVKYDVHYNITTIEPPELLDFVKKNYPEVEMIPPKNSMFDLVVKKGVPPTQRMRYCTGELKQDKGKDRFKVLGIRAEESRNRAQRPRIEINSKTRIIKPIFYWLEGEVWQYIFENKLPYCKLYDEGYSRIGCVLCPCARKKTLQQEIKKFPEIVQMYREACKAAYEKRIASGKSYSNFQSGEGIFNWWLNLLLKIKPYEPKPYEIDLFER